MSLARFAFHHPAAYRRILMTSLAVVLVGGMGLSVQANAAKRPSSKSLARSAPVAQPQQPTQAITLTRLPGSDGSARPEVVKAASVPQPVVSGDNRSLGRMMNAQRFGDTQWESLNRLWTSESNWNSSARNPSSGACGIPQALPCSKIPDMSPEGQIRWGLDYIERRYGTPARAWAHFRAHHWY